MNLSQPQAHWSTPSAVHPDINTYLAHRTRLGVLYKGDCLQLLPFVARASVDTIFADPPFNLAKHYGPRVNDRRSDIEYVNWCRTWLDECVRILKPGGSLFVYNLPKWNILLGAHLSDSGLDFRHWITINVKLSLPIPGRLYPSHYSLLYFSKGKPRVFHKIRVPIETCRHCGGEIKDYGGHRDAMNPKGVNLTDVWNDIAPVRHWKFKSRKRQTNQLSTKVLERIIQMSTDVCDLVLDPFGGSGTTFDVCERLQRHWIGIEIESSDVIIERLEEGGQDPHPSHDYVEV